MEGLLGPLDAWIARGDLVALARLVSIRREEVPLMSTIRMRLIDPADIPEDGGTAVQDDPDRPVFRGLEGDDYACAECGNLLASKMAPEYMNAKLRIRCGRCRKINAAIEVEGVDYRKAFGRGAVFGENAIGADRRRNRRAG